METGYVTPGVGSGRWVYSGNWRYMVWEVGSPWRLWTCLNSGVGSGRWGHSEECGSVTPGAGT